MKKLKIYKILLLIDIILVVLLVFFKLYSIINEPNYTASNINNVNKINQSSLNEPYSFAVVGDINNSLDIFDNYLIKKMNNDQDLKFMISTGNAVMDGAEDKYRMLNKSLSKLKIPNIITFGGNEYADGGASRFYKHYGPYNYSYFTNNGYFIFLDTTGYTSQEVEKQWLVNELMIAQNYPNIFVFMNKSPIESAHGITDSNYRDFLTTTFTTYHVTAVFSSNKSVYLNKEMGGVNYFISGGGGGTLDINNKNSFYHYIKVNVSGNTVSYQIVKQQTPFSFPILRFLQNCWIYIHSILYLNYINFFLIITVFIFIAFFVYIKVNKEVDYYRKFDISEEDLASKEHLNIAMFTNNYLPFIGGVPISIYRLAKGLLKLGHHVYIFAPKYPNSKSDDLVYRCKLLIPKKNSPFVVTNIFSRKITKEFLKKDFDVIHVHHPFWMGKKGVKIGQKYHVPVVFTYHTRLELYAHFLPVFRTTFKNIVSHKMIFHFAQNCDGIIAPTTSALEYLSEIGVSRHKIVLPTGIDFDFYQTKQNDLNDIMNLHKKDKEILLCTVSRLSKEKNIYFLLDGLKYIKEHTHIRFKCLIIGTGDELENIKETIKNNKLEDVTELLGAIPFEDIAKYYQVSDIFVFSSKSETQGMVVLEAMAGKTPVVAINSSGINDVIINNYNGFKTKDDVKDWATNVITLMENKPLLAEMSLNAYQFTSQYSLIKMAKEAENLYRYVITYKKLTHKSK